MRTLAGERFALRQVEWDGKRARAVQGDAAWAWHANIRRHLAARPCIDLGKGAPKYGSWSVLSNLDDWTGPVGDEIVSSAILRGWLFCWCFVCGALFRFSPVDPPCLYRQRSAPCSARAICADCGALRGLDRPLWGVRSLVLASAPGDMGYSMLFSTCCLSPA